MRRASFKILHIDTSKIHLMCKGVAKWGNLAPGVTGSGASRSTSFFQLAEKAAERGDRVPVGALSVREKSEKDPPPHPYWEILSSSLL